MVGTTESIMDAVTTVGAGAAATCAVRVPRGAGAAALVGPVAGATAMF